MISLDFQELLQQEPFRPFRLHLSNGTMYEILHPELAVLKFTVVWLYPSAKDLSTFGERDFTVVDLGHIIFIDLI